jgi:hypothetical protein
MTMMDPHAAALADTAYHYDYAEAFDEEEPFESFPPEFLYKSMADALERLKNFNPFE